MRSRAVSDRFKPSRILATHGLLLLTAVLIVLFSILLPETFPTKFNVRSILANESVTAFVALAVMVPLAAGEYDLSVGNILGMSSILAVGLQLKSGVSWEVAVALGIAAGALIGAINGVLVAYLQINSFIATLGFGTFMLGISEWYTHGLQQAGAFAPGFFTFANWSIFSVVPGSAVYVAVVAVVLWVVLEFLPVGRRLYALGFNRRAADLVGVPTRRYIFWAFTVSGILCGCGGVVVASQLQSSQSTLGADYLLPAFVGALLGATSVRPGRVNVGGTILAVLVLAVGISGLTQESASFFVTPLFDGGMLVAAVALAGMATRRQVFGTANSIDSIASEPSVLEGTVSDQVSGDYVPPTEE
jgi:ribose transport system permease protein